MNAFDEGKKEPESRDDYMRQKEEMQKEYGRIFMFRGLRDFGER